MRCPNCGNDTNPELPRCTHCNAQVNPGPLGGPGGTLAAGEETARDPSEHDEATRDYGVPPAKHNPFEPAPDPAPGPPAGPPPGGFGAAPADPLPPPWVPVPDPPAPGAWQPPADHMSPPQPPPSGERTTSLSPEPWAEPAIWQPPAPAKKSNAAYFLVAAGVVLLVAVALGIVFWPGGSGKPARTAAGTAAPASPTDRTVTTDESPAGSPPATGTPTTDGAPAGGMTAQAGAVDTLLDDMSRTRSDLGTVVEDGCTTEGLQGIQDQRQGQLDRAKALDVSALGNGTAMKDALVRALQASVESNQRYLDVSPGCPSDDDVADVNQEATDAKNEFIGYWAPVAEQAGLPARDGDDL